MHLIKRQGLASSLRKSSIALILAHLSLATTIGFGIVLFLERTPQNAWALGIAGGITLILRTFHWMISQNSRCQLCMVPVTGKLKCSPSSGVTPLFGSYRLKVATSIVFTGKFRCVYCGEPFSLKSSRNAATQTSSKSNRPVSVRRGGGLPPKKL